MDLISLLWTTAGILFVIFIIMLLALAFRPGRREEEMPRGEKEDLRKIKDEIEHEIEDDMMHEIEPLRKTRRGRPRNS